MQTVAALTAEAATVVIGLLHTSGGGDEALNHPASLLNRPTLQRLTAVLAVKTKRVSQLGGFTGVPFQSR